MDKNSECLERRFVMDFILEKPVFQYIISSNGIHFEILPFLGFHAKRDPTIRVKMFITLEKFSNISKVNGRMFKKL